MCTTPVDAAAMKRSSVRRLAGFFLVLVTIYLLVYVFNHLRVAPESLLLFLFAFYIILIDFFYYIAKVNRITSLVMSVVIAGLIVMYIAWQPHFNLHHLKVDYSSKDTIPFRKDLGTLRQYYDGWKERIVNRANKQKPFPVILVAGEGGGSPHP